MNSIFIFAYLFENNVLKNSTFQIFFLTKLILIFVEFESLSTCGSPITLESLQNFLPRRATWIFFFFHRELKIGIVPNLYS